MTIRIDCVAGRHLIDGTGVGVEDIMALLHAGISPGDVENKYPGLDEEDIKACVRYYLEHLQ